MISPARGGATAVGRRRVRLEHLGEVGARGADGALGDGPRMRGQLADGEAGLAERDGGGEDLREGERAGAVQRDGVGPAGGGAGDGHSVDAGHGDLAGGGGQVVAEVGEGAVGAGAAGAVEGVHGAGVRVVEEAEHVAADSG